MTDEAWTLEQIEAELAVCDHATRDPWDYLLDADLIMGDDGQQIVMDPRHGCGKGPENIAFVVHARSGYPAALKALRALLKEKAPR